MRGLSEEKSAEWKREKLELFIQTHKTEIRLIDVSFFSFIHSFRLSFLFWHTQSASWMGEGEGGRREEKRARDPLLAYPTTTFSPQCVCFRDLTDIVQMKIEYDDPATA